MPENEKLILHIIAVDQLPIAIQQKASIVLYSFTYINTGWATTLY